MATTNEALLAAMLSNSGQIQESPWSGAGASILQSQLPKATNNTEAILGPILQGLIGGGLTGYGQGQTNKAAFDAYGQNPILQSLMPEQVGPVADGQQYATDLLANEYAGEMPSGWTPQQGKSDLISAMIAKQAVIDDEASKAEQRQKIQTALLPKGMTLSETGEVVPAAGFAEANAEIARAEAEAKNKAEGLKPIQPPAAIVSELADQKGIIDAATQIGNTLKDGKKSWADLRKAEMFSGLDEDGISASVSDLADRVLRSRSGAAAPVQEVAKLRKIIAGDRTVTPEEAGNLILKFAQREKENAMSKIDLVNNPDGLQGFKTSFESSGPKITVVPKGAAPTGRKTKSGKPTYIINGVEGVLE